MMIKKLALLFVALPSLAFGQSSPNWPDGYRPSMVEWNAEFAMKRDYAPTPVPPPGTAVLYATDFGVIADGVTSNDLQLKNAITACAVLGTRLVLPPGQITLTGAMSSTPSNCHIDGTGPQAWLGNGGGSPGGTTFKLTGTINPPFIAGNSVTFSNLNFWWPNQDGTIVYPPAITDAGSGSIVNNLVIEDVTFVNCYDCVAQSENSAGWGNAKFHNISFFSINDGFRLSNTGDGFVFSNLRADAGPWLNVCGSTCLTGVGIASARNRDFHITNKTGGGGAVNLAISPAQLSGRYGFLLDAGATVAESNINATWDGNGTIIDASASGARWFADNVFTGNNAGCFIPFNASKGNNPCFNMGANSELDLTGFLSSGSQGSYIVTSGSSIKLDGGKSANIGSAADGSEYYHLQVTGGTPTVIVQNMLFGGADCGALPAGCHHVHGINTASSTPGILTIQNNSFSFLQDAVVVANAGGIVISGNLSNNTHGSATLTISGTSGVMYGQNFWDIPPIATPLSCGAGCVVAGGGLRGSISMGTGSVTAATITLPFTPAPTAGTGVTTCFAQVVNPSQGAGCSVTGKVMSLNFTSSVGGEAVIFDALPSQ